MRRGGRGRAVGRAVPAAGPEAVAVVRRQGRTARPHPAGGQPLWSTRTNPLEKGGRGGRCSLRRGRPRGQPQPGSGPQSRTDPRSLQPRRQPGAAAGQAGQTIEWTTLSRLRLRGTVATWKHPPEGTFMLRTAPDVVKPVDNPLALRLQKLKAEI